MWCDQKHLLKCEYQKVPTHGDSHPPVPIQTTGTRTRIVLDCTLTPIRSDPSSVLLPNQSQEVCDPVPVPNLKPTAIGDLTDREIISPCDSCLNSDPIEGGMPTGIKIANSKGGDNVFSTGSRGSLVVQSQWRDDVFFWLVGWCSDMDGCLPVLSCPSLLPDGTCGGVPLDTADSTDSDGDSQYHQYHCEWRAIDCL